jgi:hypothetical protein
MPATTSSIDSRITSRSTSCRWAPGAMRMPISFVRRATLADTGREADRREQDRQAPSIAACAARSGASRFSTCSIWVATSIIGRFGSI